MLLYYSAVTAHAGVAEWQTRQTQNLLVATSYGFKSHRRHSKALDFTEFLEHGKSKGNQEGNQTYVRLKLHKKGAFLYV